MDAAVETPDARFPNPVDASVDASRGDAMQPPTDDAGVLVFGDGVVLDDVRFASAGHALSPWAPLVNQGFQTAIEGGDMIMLVELRGLDDPSGQNDADGVDVALYLGEDPDGDPSNNFTGSAELEVAAGSLDPLGNPITLLSGATLENGQVSGSVAGTIVLPIPELGDLRLRNSVFVAELIAAGDGMSVAELRNGRLRGVMAAPSMEALPNPAPELCVAGSMLDLIALPCLSFDGIQPDVDGDDDGLETFDEMMGMFDGVIDLCVDGDGTLYTSIPGLQCVLDPAFADGYTLELEVGGVRALLQPPAQPL